MAHLMCVKGRDSIIVQDVEERKPTNQPAKQIPKKEMLMMLAILNANEMFNYPPCDCVALHLAQLCDTLELQLNLWGKSHVLNKTN